MKYFANLRVKAIRNWNKNSKKILITILVIIIIITINQILKNMPKKIEPPQITYTPHISVVQEEEVPKKYQEPIANILERYVTFCNNQEYEKAYNLITDECKKAYYPTLEQFTGYVNYVFQGKKKSYDIQSYSIVDNVYVYRIRIFDNFMANGTTDGFGYYEEKFILKEENGNIKLSIGEFISQDNPQVAVEDEYMKVRITERTVDYESETYTIVVENKTDDKYIVIADGSQTNEVKIDLGSRQDLADDVLEYFVVAPGKFRVQKVKFTKFYDSGNTTKGIVFGAVRILEKYDSKLKTTQENLDNAVKLYSMEIPIE